MGLLLKSEFVNRADGFPMWSSCEIRTAPFQVIKMAASIGARIKMSHRSMRLGRKRRSLTGGSHQHDVYPLVTDQLEIDMAAWVWGTGFCSGTTVVENHESSSGEVQNLLVVGSVMLQSAAL